MLTPRQLLLGSFPGMRSVPCPEKRAILRFLHPDGNEECGEYIQFMMAFSHDEPDHYVLDKWEYGLRRYLEDKGIGRNATIVWRLCPEIEPFGDSDSVSKICARFAAIPGYVTLLGEAG